MGGGLGGSPPALPRLPLEAVGTHVDGEPQDGAGLVAEQRVQGVLLGACDGAGQHQHGADVVDLLEGRRAALEILFLKKPQGDCLLLNGEWMVNGMHLYWEQLGVRVPCSGTPQNSARRSRGSNLWLATLWLPANPLYLPELPLP